MILSNSLSDTSDFELVAKTAIGILGQPLTLEAGVELVDEEEIRAVNRQQRNCDKETDVLSFPTLELKEGEIVDPSRHTQDVDPETGALYLGDVLICEQVARRQAEEYGHSYRRELCYLFTHALLHLFGYDHMTAEDKAVMRAREEEILGALRIVREGEDA